MKTSLMLHDRTHSNVTGPRARLGATTLWLLIVGLIARLGTGSIAQAAGVDVTLAWEPTTAYADGTPATDVQGYKVYFGSQSRLYTNCIDVGNVTSARLSGFEDGVTYYLAITTYNVVGNESAFSEELVRSTADSDGDGMADSQELLAGTDPYDPNSVLRLVCPDQSAGMSEAGLVIAWTSVAGKYYTVERSTNLLAVPVFKSIVTHVAGQSPITVYRDTTATGNGPYYFRVQVEP